MIGSNLEEWSSWYTILYVQEVKLDNYFLDRRYLSFNFHINLHIKIGNKIWNTQYISLLLMLQCRTTIFIIYELIYTVCPSSICLFLYKNWTRLEQTDCIFSISRGGKNIMVMCETYKYNKEPTETNHRKVDDISCALMWVCQIFLYAIMLLSTSIQELFVFS